MEVSIFHKLFDPIETFQENKIKIKLKFFNNIYVEKVNICGILTQKEFYGCYNASVKRYGASVYVCLVHGYLAPAESKMAPIKTIIVLIFDIRNGQKKFKFIFEFYYREQGIRDHWKSVQTNTENFYKRWSLEYLSELQKRYKWVIPNRNIKPGTLVLLKDHNTPPICWRRGRVIRTILGSDGLCRMVDVRTSNGETKRSINNVCPFPTEENEVLDTASSNLTYFVTITLFFLFEEWQGHPNYIKFGWF